MGQEVGFLKVIKSVATVETSAQVARHIVQSSSPVLRQQSIHRLKSLPSKTMHCKHTP